MKVPATISANAAVTIRVNSQLNTKNSFLRAGFDESPDNQGFLPLGDSKVLVRLNGKVEEIDLDETNDLPAQIDIFIYTVLTKYRYLIG